MVTGHQVTIGEALADIGAGLAADAAPEWSARARRWITARVPGEPFTADDLVAAIGLPNGDDAAPGRNNAVGAAIRAAARAGLIRPGGYAPAARAASHARVLRVWIAAGASPWERPEW